LAPNSSSAATAAPPAKTPEQLALERELSGAVFSSHGTGPVPGTANTGDPSAANGGSLNGASDLSTLLRPSVMTAVRAQMLPAQRLLLPKGAFLDCTLETAIDSTLPGMTTCVTATDTFGVDGKVVLLERGTKLIGETRGQVQQGAARIFVLWTEARTPAGVVVPLDSPGADELGRSGLPGEVNRHFWQRFGAAMLVSVIDGAVQAASQSSRGGSGAVVVNPSASQDVLTEILKNTISIPPTVVKQNGDRIQVLVARDVDFRSVYELRSAAGR
jgi:type IV secretion system protein VirB10